MGEINEIVKILFGEYTGVQLFGYFWFFIVGYIIYGLTEASSRDKNSPSTPVKWSWKFWFLDNWRRYLTTVLCTYILFRFYTEVNGAAFTYFDAVTLGLVGDGIAATMKKKVKAIGADREQLMTENDARVLVAENKVEAKAVVVENKLEANTVKAEQDLVADELLVEQQNTANELKG